MGIIFGDLERQVMGPEQWAQRLGPITLSAKSSNLTAQDLFTRRYVHSSVNKYAGQVSNLDELKLWITDSNNTSMDGLESIID